MRTGVDSVRRAGGFTIVELLIVMGMLGIFLIFLTQMLGSSLRLWQHGETRASLAARATMALRILGDDFERVRGLTDRQWMPGREERFAELERSAGAPPLTGRLLARQVAFRDARPATSDLALDKPEAADWYPELRMAVTLEVAEADSLLRARVRRDLVGEEGQLAEAELEERVRARVAELPPRVAAEVALRVLPTGEEDGCYLAIHRDVRLLAQGVGPRWVDLAPLPPPGEALVGNVLWVEILFRSQATESWDAAPGSRGGPESCWDSARAGTFPEGHPVLVFSGDLDESSLMDPLDDIMPSWVQIRVTVDEGPGVALTALLGRDLDPRSREVFVEFPDRLPEADEQPYLKIGAEWIRYSGRAGGRLLGVQRGQRHTRVRAHRAGARVHAGREVSTRIPIATRREYWNGR